MARDYAALTAYLDASAARTFAFSGRRGTHDCVRFAGGAVQAQTGENPLKGLNWRSRKAAEALLAQYGGLAAAVDTRLAAVHLALAKRGDIALVEIEGRPSLGVVEGHTIAAPGLLKIVRLPRAVMTNAWSAG